METLGQCEEMVWQLQKRIAELERENEQLRAQNVQLRAENESIFYPLKDEMGKVVEVVLVHQDTADWWQAQQALREAEAEKQAAVLLERVGAAQERVVELAKANEALKRTISKLAEEPQLDAFRRNVMTAAAEQVGACSSALFVYDENTHTLIMKAFVDDGQPVDIATDPRMEIWRLPVPADLGPAWELFLRQGGHVIHEMDESDPNAWPHSIEWHRMMGHVSVLCLPLVVGGRPVGFIGFDFKHRAEVADEKVELARALTHQATLALELTRLAEEAKEAALAKLSEGIAREQEKAARERVADLTRVNAVLSDSLSRLSQQADPEVFLAHVVGEIVHQMSAANAMLLRFEEDQRLARLHLFHDGQSPRWGMSGAELPLFAAPFATDVTPAFSMSLAVAPTANPALGVAGIFVASRYDGSLPVEQFALPGGLEWMARIGASDAAFMILFAGEQPLGTLHLHFTGGRQLRPDDDALFIALSRQAAIALRLCDLAAQSRETAIAREQEKAAQSRVAKLIKANEALKHNLDSLATQPELDQFLGCVISQSVAQIGAARAHLFLYDDQTHSLLLHLATEGEKLVNWRQLPDMEVFSRPIPADVTPGWEVLVSTRTPLSFDLAVNFDLHWPGTQDWHRRRGHTRALCIVLMLDQRPLGMLGLCFTSDAAITPEAVELVHALTQQATLAIQLNYLAQQGRQSAILEERNRIAREMHDTLAQALTGIIIHLAAAQEAVAIAPDTAEFHLTRASTLARNGLSEARRSVQALRPSVLETADLPTALSRMTEQMSEGTAIQTQVGVDGIPFPLPPQVELNLMRIGQEALTNALKYAQAQTIQLQLRYETQMVQLRIVDDGQGFEVQTRLDTEGFGLIGMQERTALMRGTLTITTQLGQGTEICVRVPV